jgi:hypothetical protein
VIPLPLHFALASVVVSPFTSFQGIRVSRDILYKQLLLLRVLGQKNRLASLLLPLTSLIDVYTLLEPFQFQTLAS